AGRSGFAFASRPDAGAVFDAGRNSDFHVPGRAVVLNRDTAARAGERFLERQIDRALEISSAPGPFGPRPTGGRPAGSTAATEKRMEEIGERVVGPEHLSHLFGRHGPVAAARSTAEMNVPAGG